MGTEPSQNAPGQQETLPPRVSGDNIEDVAGGARAAYSYCSALSARGVNIATVVVSAHKFTQSTF